MNHLEKYTFAKLAFSPSDVKFKVGPSNIAGNGLFANSSFKAGEKLFPLFWLRGGQDFNQGRKQGKSIQWPRDVAWGNLTMHVNHQKSSNCSIKEEGGTWYCVSKKPLTKGAEITIDYRKAPSFADSDITGFIEK